MAYSDINNEGLRQIRDALQAKQANCPVRSWQIRDHLAKCSPPIVLDESTIRGRFIAMGQPLSSISSGIATNSGPAPVRPNEPIPEPKKEQPKTPLSKALDVVKKVFDIPSSLYGYIPKFEEFSDYLERPIDKRLATHYDSSRPGNWKYPLTQGKQGTGKTLSHRYYAFKQQLPFFLYQCHEDFKLHKLFGDKTIESGNVVFKESVFVQSIQHPGVSLFDEVNYVSNENSVDFHAFLQNRELFVKDADNGNGKTFRLHNDHRVGFAQNPKSAKYIGGNIKPSNFLGRCTFLTYPEFSKYDITDAIRTRFPNLHKDEVKRFVQFYFACIDLIESGKIPIDISIRQLNNVIDLYNHGMPLNEAIEDGLSSMMEAVSLPMNKEAVFKLAQAVWKEMMNLTINENVGQWSSMINRFIRRL